MFEKLKRELKRLERSGISIPIGADEEGSIDKECPSENCGFVFKVREENWKNLFKDEAVYCPLCGHEADSNCWWTTEQVKNAEKQGQRFVEGTIDYV